jgi:hypothetical protein
MQTHALVGCILLVQRLLLKLSGIPRWRADKFVTFRRKQNLSPMPKGRLIKLAKSHVFWARHGVAPSQSDATNRDAELSVEKSLPQALGAT